MEFIDIGLTAFIVGGAFIFMIRHFVGKKNNCSSCTGCSKSGTCRSSLIEIQDAPEGKH